MTNTVIHMTHSVDRDLVNRLFAKFASKYGKLWTTRLGEGGDWAGCVDDWFDELSKFSLEQVRAAVNKALTIYRDFPPTQGQLIDLCLAESGVPDLQQIIRAMVDRDFGHPLVKMVYDKIGSWTLTNGKETEINSKASAAYSECLADFTIDPQSCWQKLTDFNAKPKELPAPSKIPSTSESKAFRECMTKCQELLSQKKIAGGGKTYKEFPANQIKKGHKEFDQAIFDEYKAYLLSIPETETIILPPVYLMERNKFLNMAEQTEWLKKQGYVPPKEREGFASPKGSDRSGAGKPVKVYKNWAHD